MDYPKNINNLIECFKKLPGIGNKTAERLALATLNLDDEVNKLFGETIINIKTKIKRCSKCNNLTEEELCSICLNKQRNKKMICVVEEVKNINLFEKVGSYDGLYFVLNKLISPLNGVNPDDTNINQLIKRINLEKIDEVILAVRPSIEGQTTALYIVKLLEHTNVIVSKIASGIPIGADMEYIDTLTLEIALEDRQKISKLNE
ncbi:MAG: recombination mediator RecR [Bacilli bacterium]